jgi:alkanesulfonate monooxygenase SsuD/methylene tetrahydromethanopterin reductase-like flavin-dependent oxidoreductase (luciferase family)
MLGEQLTRKQRTDRFAEFVGLLDRTLSQDHVDHAGEFYQAVDARNAPGCTQQPRVPFVVAANGPRAMGLAARHGQGWLTTGQGRGLATGPRGDAGQVDQWWRGTAELAERFEEISTAAGRTQGAAVDRYLSLDACGVPALSSAGFFEDQQGRAEALGFSDVVVHWPRDTDPYQATIGTLEEVAARHLTGSAVP